mmetsp:Transcript_16445/g.32143  ORF Transcript_16445/g.32143 Transcript_16445/m.32143 type:complete len:126 (-) Transcript_16445:87-464(-)
MSFFAVSTCVRISPTVTGVLGLTVSEEVISVFQIFQSHYDSRWGFVHVYRCPWSYCSSGGKFYLPLWSRGADFTVSCLVDFQDYLSKVFTFFKWYWRSLQDASFCGRSAIRTVPLFWQPRHLLFF